MLVKELIELLKTQNPEDTVLLEIRDPYTLKRPGHIHFVKSHKDVVYIVNDDLTLQMRGE